MKTETEGLSREEFEKLREDFVERWVDVDKRSIARAGFHAGYAAASSLKQADLKRAAYRIIAKLPNRDNELNRVGAVLAILEEEFEGKQAEPPSQPAMSAELDELVRDLTKVGPRPKSEVRRRILALAEAYAKHVAESPSQASTQPPSQCPRCGHNWKFGEIRPDCCGFHACGCKHDWHSIPRSSAKESISQATKEDWARRIADMQPQWFDDEPAEVRFKNVLAILDEPNL